MAATPADVLIEGGLVYDGGEGAPVTADVVITGERVVYVGPAARASFTPRTVVEASHRLVLPGFIDAHAHPDTYVRSAQRTERLNAPWLFQGATTLLVGVDGAGTPDVDAERAKFERDGIGTNLVPYVGFGAVRERVLGHERRAPTAAELASMRALVAKGMCEGAIGLSTGLFYAPQSFATTAEVVELAREAGLRGGLYDTHQRDESSYSIGLLNSVREVLDIGREAGLPVHIAHIKALGVDVQGQAPAVIGLIDEARAKGQAVTADQYPWSASGSNLEASLVPLWAFDGGRPALLKRLADPGLRSRLETEMTDNLRRRGGPESLLLTSAGTPWVGRTLGAVAGDWHVGPLEAARRIIASGEGRDDVASFNMSEADIRLFMRSPWVVTSSDGSDGHPRQYATFPYKYRRYVNETHVLSLGEFIAGSTGRTADTFGLDHRGYLRAGYFADVLVLDPATYAPEADYVHPRRLSKGVTDLWVNGRAVVRNGALTGEAPGRVLRHAVPKGHCP